ncbi:MAG: hypothetical protein RSB29_06440, partial [Alistipes sp.]
FSDLIHFDDASALPSSQVALDEEEFHVDMAEVAEQIVADSLPPAVQTTFAWQIGSEGVAAEVPPDSVRFADVPREGITPIEDFDTTSNGLMQALYAKLYDGEAVRIAVLGDSFIEGDILTSDLRERLQEVYDGSGAGFAPMASPLTGFRRTVKTQSKGWTAYNIMQYRTTPQALRDEFYISGWVCRAEPGAQTRWECATSRKHLDPCGGARILFVSRGKSRAEVTVNDTLRRSFAIEGDPALRQVEISGGAIHSLVFRVVEGSAGVVGYGALLEGGRVGVDNYSIRSNNGQAMFRTNPTINAQANAMLHYDLVVLQYGLNIMQQGIHNYANYGAQIEKMIAYVRECFPSAAVLVLGVSDRSVRTADGFAPMDAVPYMIQCQRKAAERNGAAFWDTAAAMRAMGGMAHFVANGWAGKDYTHINYAGGRRVAYALSDALNEAVINLPKTRSNKERPEEMIRGIADSVQQQIRSDLFIPAILK